MRWARLTVFMDAESYKMTSGYQLWNSLLALGSGGWTGVGFTESRLKLLYLPENHTDFILSIVGEELGFITLLTVIVAYLILVFVGLRISVKARTAGPSSRSETSFQWPKSSIRFTYSSARFTPPV